MTIINKRIFENIKITKNLLVVFLSHATAERKRRVTFCWMIDT